VPAADTLYVDAAFSPTIARPDAAEVFALSPAMRAYLQREIAPRMATHSPQRALIDHLYSGQQLLIDYDAELTRTAAEAFEAQAGNCLSLVIMTGALAKAMGLAVRYQAVEVDHSWAREGDLALYMGHVNIAIGRRVATVRVIEDSPDWWTVDFMSPPDARRLRSQPITEQRVVAMYFNNKAAEAMTRGRLDDAYAWSRAALEADPLYTDAYNTLGVVYLRQNDAQQAERVFAHVLEREPANTRAMFNLVLALQRQGRAADAQAWQQRLAALEPEPPFHFFHLGLAAMRQNDYAAARDWFSKEISRAAYHHESHFWLGVASYRLGEVGQARKHLALAMENSPTRGERDLYAAKLSWLQGGTRARH
jgi:tetratricopeptide (TPR) repeat protein